MEVCTNVFIGVYQSRFLQLSGRWFRAGRTFRRASRQLETPGASTLRGGIEVSISLRKPSKHSFTQVNGTWRGATCGFSSRKGSYLVDPASSHMLVSKIKPCMSKYKLLIL